MSAPVAAASKRRTLVTEQTISGAVSVPSFPTGPDASGRVSFAGDMQGAVIHGVEFATGVLAGGLTSLGALLEHSSDGVVWSTFKAAIPNTGSQTVTAMFTDTDLMAKRFFRVTFSAVAGGFGTAPNTIVRLLYDQPRPPGNLRPPGYVDRAH